MNKSFLIVLAASVIILTGGALLFSQKAPEITIEPPSAYEYYWGETCPHCAKVAEFFDTWDKKDAVQIEHLEVYNNAENARKMAQRAASCDISQNELGVPFLVTPEAECLMGDEPIIDHFKALEL